MEGVAELVEHRDHVVPCQQAGCSFGGAGEVACVGHHRKGASQVRLVYDRGHPRPTTFSGPGERVEDHCAQRSAVCLADFVHLGIWSEATQIVSCVESDAVEGSCSSENTIVQHPVIFQVRAQFGRIDGLGGGPFRGVVFPVPGGEFCSWDVLIQSLL